MISFVCFKWRPREGYRSAYGPETVNTLASMVARHYRRPHRFICVTDDAEGLAATVEPVPLWDDHAGVPNPSFRTGPSCYRRLRVFARDIGALLGDRFVCVDLDTVFCAPLEPLFDRPEDFVCWRNPDPRWPLNGSMFLLRAGARPQVWETFDPATSPAVSHAARCYGSDQGWMSYVLGSNEATWGEADGVYSYQMHLRKLANKLPLNACAVMFHGAADPWSATVHKVAPWVVQHYR